MNIRDRSHSASVLAVVLLTACGGSDVPADRTPEAEVTPAAAFDPEPWITRGSEVQRATFAALSGELRGAMEAGGVPEALRYCNVAAYPLTDSLSAAYDVAIRRATLQPRNPSNRATSAEADVLERYAAQLAAGEELAPVVEAVDDETVAYFAPIRIQGLCLNCHGEVGVDVAPEHAALIGELYPEDEAVGYAEGDLRGVWSLSFRAAAADSRR